MRNLVVVPTYNEKDNLRPLVQEVLSIDRTIDILVIDDGSPDGTGLLADRLARETGRLHVLHRPGKLGLGTAYAAGFRFALAGGYDRAIEMDADFSHRPRDLPRLLEAATRADVVVGSRNVPGGQALDWSPLRNFISKGGSLFARSLLGLPVHDCTSGFKCLSRRALEALDLNALRSSGYAFQVEVNYACAQAGLRFAEVPIIFPNRVRGQSKMSGRIVLEAAWVVVGLRMGHFQAPIRRPLGMAA